MRILFLTSGSRIPSTRFRVLAYLPYLRKQGHQCTAVSGFPHKYDYVWWIGFRPSQMLKRLVRMLQWLAACVRRYDVVFVEREIFNDDTFSMEDRFRKIAPRMVLDVDDAVFINTPAKIEHLARISDLVIVGSPQIEERIKPWNPNTSVIPTSVELKRYPQKQHTGPADATPIIGWMGTTANLDYLNVIAAALRQLATLRNFELRLIVPAIDPLQGIDLAGVNIRHVVWSGETEVAELSQVDVGVMPLFPDRPWDRYKCPTKLIQYMALGIPGVASPIGFTADVMTDGVDGFFAKETDDWVQALCRLIDDASLRGKVGQAARQTVTERFCVEANAPRLLQALTGTVAPASSTSPERP